MGILFKRKTYYLVFFFSKYLILSSVALSFLFTALKGPLPSILLFKIIFWGVVYIFQLESSLHKRLTFYNNLGLSKNKLFVLSFLFDVILFLSILILVRIWF